MKNENHSCENCAHYFQHYGWTANHFVKVCCGHCKKNKYTKKEQKNFPFINGCEEWQPKEKEIARQKKNLAENLNCMAIKINEIKDWLESCFLKL